MKEYTQFNLAGIILNAGMAGEKAIVPELKRLGITKPLIVTDRGVVEAGIIEHVKNLLSAEDIPCAIYDGVLTDPIDSMVEEGLAIFLRENCDGILSVGGGSSMDTGKCISVMSVHEGKILEYSNYARRSGGFYRTLKQKGCPIMAVPTTSGTGSEVSMAAVITDSKTHRKTTISTSYFFSSSVILVPEYATSMSPEITAYTAMDALSHAIEAFTSKPAIENEIRVSDIMALDAIAQISKSLPIAYKDGKDVEARRSMQWAALTAGISLNIAAGEAHALGSMLAKYYGVCHGISVGIALPYVMEYNIPYCPHRFARVAEAMGVNTAGMSLDEAAHAAVEAVKQLQKQVNFAKMGDYIHSMDEVKAFSEECAGNSCCVINGRMDNKEAIEEVFRRSLEDT